MDGKIAAPTNANVSDLNIHVLAQSGAVFVGPAENVTLTNGTMTEATASCSRAHLYRIFERDRSVGGALRQISSPAPAHFVADLSCPIDTIAFECGYTDYFACGKAFRRQFDHSPQDCRKAALGATGHRT